MIIIMVKLCWIEQQNISSNIQNWGAVWELFHILSSVDYPIACIV